MLLYDLTSNYFQCDAEGGRSGGKKRHGYIRDKRPDCVQVVIALIVTPQRLPLDYEVVVGNTLGLQTLRGFLKKIELLYGKAERLRVMDRGIPTEEVLEKMRAIAPPVHCIVGTPKCRLPQFEKRLLLGNSFWRPGCIELQGPGLEGVRTYRFPPRSTASFTVQEPSP